MLHNTLHNQKAWNVEAITCIEPWLKFSLLAGLQNKGDYSFDLCNV